MHICDPAVWEMEISAEAETFNVARKGAVRIAPEIVRV